jgi:hypothetical protein
MLNKKSQTEVDQTVLDFLGDQKIQTPEDLVFLLKIVHSSLEFRPYNEKTKKHADSIQWKRTAAEIIRDGYVYQGKACSDLVLVFITLCKGVGVDGNLLKLVNLENARTHSIAEVKLADDWYRIDTSYPEAKPFKGRLADNMIWNKNWQGGWKLWKRGKDLWSLGLDDIELEKNIISNE